MNINIDRLFHCHLSVGHSFPVIFHDGALIKHGLISFVDKRNHWVVYGDHNYRLIFNTIDLQFHLSLSLSLLSSTLETETCFAV